MDMNPLVDEWQEWADGFAPRPGCGTRENPAPWLGVCEPVPVEYDWLGPLVQVGGDAHDIDPWVTFSSGSLRFTVDGRDVSLVDLEAELGGERLMDADGKVVGFLFA